MTQNGAATRRSYVALSFGSMVLGAVVGALVYPLFGHKVFTGVVLGVMWAGIARMLFWGIGNTFRPVRMLSWRQRYMQGTSGLQSEIGAAFDRGLQVSGQDPERNPVALRRVRMIGIWNLLMAAVFIVVIVLIAGWLDTIYR